MTGVMRQAEPKDRKAMAELDRICFAVPWSEESFRKELEENDLAFYLVAELDGELIGYAGLWAIMEEGHITNVAVHPDHRRKGLARILVMQLMDAGEKNGLERFTLEVRPSNTAALALYTSLGFQEAGRRTGYYKDNGEDALILWR